MPGAQHHHRFSQQLYQFSQRLDELILQARRFDAQHIPLEILDEMAITIGELTLLLSDHLAVEHTQALAQKMISHAEGLRQKMRAGKLSKEQLADAIEVLTQELYRMIAEDKRAA